MLSHVPESLSQPRYPRGRARSAPTGGGQTRHSSQRRALRRSRRLEGPPRGAAAAAGHCWPPPHLPRGRCEVGSPPSPVYFQRLERAPATRSNFVFASCFVFFFFFRLPRERFIHTIKVNRKVQPDRVSSAFPSSSTRSEGLSRAQPRRGSR